MEIHRLLERQNLLADGAFGTYYAEKYRTREMPELANLLYPDRVREIHREYLAAGAALIRTNTFAANTVLVQKSWPEVEQLIRQAVRLAREAAEPYARAGRPVFIAGDIGPIPAQGGLPGEAEEEYCRIARLFAESGVSILNFETFPDTEQILPAIQGVREGFDCFVMVSFSVNQFGYSAAGLSARRLLSGAAQSGWVDAVGLNCGVGPGHMCQLLGQLDLSRIAGSLRQGEGGRRVYLTALPNAGYPSLSRDQLAFGNTPAYFAGRMEALASLGVDLLGGCCGTNPAFIRQMAQTPDIGRKRPAHSLSQGGTGERETVGGRPPRIEREAGCKRKLVAVELAPPFDADDDNLLESAYLLKKAGVDLLTFPDSPSGRTRVDSVLMAEKVRRMTGMEVMPHICCRDKNALAMRALFMGAHINDIHNLLIVTGDPLPSAARQTVKAVFQFDSIGLMRILQEMNQEVFGERPLRYGGAVNQGRGNLEAEIRRVQKKMEAGASFFLTQPVFTAEDADRLRTVKERTGAVLFCGIMPLVNRKNALFMKNEIAGVHVTDQLVERYPEQASREEGEAVGVALAREVIAMVEDFADGYYFSFPFNRTYLLSQILGPAD